MKTIKAINTISVLLTVIFAICVLAATLTPEAPKEWQYTRMGAQVNYTVGQRVENDGRIYECIQWDEGSPLVMVPPAANPAWWAEVH